MRTKRTLGVDLSADPENTAACLIRWDEEGAEIEELVKGSRRRPIDDDRLLDLIGRATKCGIDAPFGWPVPFVEAVRAWEQSWNKGGEWPEVEDYDDYRWRVTDRQVVEPRPPLSVSTDLLGVTAFRCAALLAKLGDRVDRSGAKGLVIEVYPAAALKHWGLDAEGYKKSKGKEVRLKLVSQLCKRLKGLCPLEGDHRDLCERSDDALDALIASLVVRARLLGKTSKPSSSEREHARIEGWLHIPSCRLAELAA
jgi:hypothetical protein